MSDLIEKIRKCANMPCMDMEGNPDPSGYRSGMWITAEDADQILSALETVRGIEEIELLKITKEKDFWVVTRGWCGEVKFWMKPTLSAAIEAARKQ